MHKLKAIWRILTNKYYYLAIDTGKEVKGIGYIDARFAETVIDLMESEVHGDDALQEASEILQ